MNCLSHVSTYTAAIFRRTSHIVTASSTISWKRKTNFDYAAIITPISLQLVLPRFRVHCYSSRRAKKTAIGSPKLVSETEMEQEKDAFFVVRKGDVVGVYNTLTDCQAQVGPSVCDPPVSVYKGYSLPKDTEEYLISRGLKNAIYTIRAADLKEDLFGTLVPCIFQDPASSKGEASGKDASKKRSQEVLGSEIVEPIGLGSISIDSSRKHVKLDHSAVAQVILPLYGVDEAKKLTENQGTCILEFDGASKGNPGQAGAGAVLRADDGSLICRVRQGLGEATNNVAEYRAMILGLKCALKRGFTSIRVQGDSKLVCMQVQGLWKVKNENMSNLYKEAKKLTKKFLSFQVNHVLRDLNSEADVQANLAVSLSDGQIEEEWEK